MVLENSLNLILTNGQEPCVLRGTCLRCKEVCVFTDPNVDTTREVSAAGDEEDVMESAPSHSGTDTNSASAHTSTARVSSQCRIYLQYNKNTFCGMRYLSHCHTLRWLQKNFIVICYWPFFKLLWCFAELKKWVSNIRQWKRDECTMTPSSPNCVL